MLASLLACTVVRASEESADVYDLPLDQLVNVEVSAASRFKQKSSEAPSAVEVLTAENIKSYGWRTLADALNSIRGLYIRNDRGYTYLGNRGFSRPGDYNARVLIMVDGRRMNETVFDSGFIGEEFLLDMNLIERIEYVPGSGSSVYGANALLGVVNVITKRGRDVAGLKLGGEVGSLDTSRTRATYGKQWDNGAELLLQGSQFYSHGNERLFFPEFKDINGGYAVGIDQERNSRAFGKFAYGDFTLRGGYVERFKRIPTASFGALFNNPENISFDSQGYADLSYLHEFGSDLGLELRAFHHWYDYNSLTPYEYENKDSSLYRVDSKEVADSRWWGGEAKLTGTQFAHHKWLLGLELQYDQHQHFNSFDINPYYSYYNAENQGWRVGTYAQDEYRITNNLLINGGLRLDYHHLINDLQLNPRIGLIWDISPAFTAKLLYGSAFRAPNVLEILPDPERPLAAPHEELVKSYEAVAEWYPGGGLKLLGNLFYNDMTQILMADPTKQTGNTVNAGNFRLLGFELGAEKLWDSGRQFKLTWTHNYARKTLLGIDRWATDSPRNLVKVHYAEPIWQKKLRLGIEEIFVDERLTSNHTIAPGYHLLNLNLALAKPIYGIEASVGVYNVLDQKFKIVAGPSFNKDTLAMDGRTVRFRMEYGF